MKKEAEQKKQQAERIDRRAVCNKKEKKRKEEWKHRLISLRLKQQQQIVLAYVLFEIKKRLTLF